DAMAERGALFVTELAASTRRLVTDIETALWDGVARGLVTADGFAAIRFLLDGRKVEVRPPAPNRDRPRAMPPGPRRQGLRRGASSRSAGEGRWTLVPTPQPVDDRDALAEAVAEQLLARWGVVFRDLVARETLAVPWRDVVWALR